MSDVFPIHAFRDNFIWSWRGPDSRLAVVDPGEAAGVLSLLEQESLMLDSILLTHHHPDHTGGVSELLAAFPGAQVWGPHDERLPAGTRMLGHDDQVKVFGEPYRVIEVPGHTRSHIAFHGQGRLFSGDTLFSVGCGRLFEGTPAQMQESLDRLAALPDDTLVYCGHEYTRANIRFAQAVEPDNPALAERAREANQLRERGLPTLPVRLDTERATNPFLRSREAGVIAAAQQRQPGATAAHEILGVIRAWKDSGDYPGA